MTAIVEHNHHHHQYYQPLLQRHYYREQLSVPAKASLRQLSTSTYPASISTSDSTSSAPILSPSLISTPTSTLTSTACFPPMTLPSKPSANPSSLKRTVNNNTITIPLSTKQMKESIKKAMRGKLKSSGGLVYEMDKDLGRCLDTFVVSRHLQVEGAEKTGGLFRAGKGERRGALLGNVGGEMSVVEGIGAETGRKGGEVKSFSLPLMSISPNILTDLPSPPTSARKPQHPPLLASSTLPHPLLPLPPSLASTVTEADMVPAVLLPCNHHTLHPITATATSNSPTKSLHRTTIHRKQIPPHSFIDLLPESIKLGIPMALYHLSDLDAGQRCRWSGNRFAEVLLRGERGDLRSCKTERRQQLHGDNGSDGSESDDTEYEWDTQDDFHLHPRLSSVQKHPRRRRRTAPSAAARQGIIPTARILGDCILIRHDRKELELEHVEALLAFLKQTQLDEDNDCDDIDDYDDGILDEGGGWGAADDGDDENRCPTWQERYFRREQRRRESRILRELEREKEVKAREGHVLTPPNSHIPPEEMGRKKRDLGLYEDDDST